MKNPTIKTQNFGVEIEMTGITRCEAAQVIADYYGTTSSYLGTYYKTYGATDRKGRTWKAMSDASIETQKRSNGRKVAAGTDYSCEVVTPILQYEDMEDLQNIIRALVAKGAFANIEPRPGSRVPVGIWRITEAHERSLDRYEGFPHLYYKQEFSLVVDGNRITAMAYIMTPGRPWVPPIQPYLRTIRQGYEDFNITSDRNLIYAAGHPVKGVSKYAASRDPIFQQRPVR